MGISDCADTERWLDNGYELFFNSYGMYLPAERKLPEALNELFRQLQKLLEVDLTELLGACLKNAERVHRQIQERTATVRSLMQEYGIYEGRDSGAAITFANRRFRKRASGRFWTE